MRIGVDARLLAHQLTGIGRYTVEMCRELSSCDDNFYLYAPSAPVVDVVEKENVQVKWGHFNGRLLSMAWSQSVLPYWAKEDHIDVFWGPTHRLPRYLPASIPRVVTIHDMVWKFAGETMRPLSLRVERRLMPEAVRLADRIIADSESTADDIGEEYPEVQDRIRVVHLGSTPMPPSLGAASLRALGVELPYFLFVGTLEPRKNLNGLLSAFALLPPMVRKACKLVIAGGKGWGGVELSSMVQGYRLEDDVVVVGYVTDEQLSTLYTHARFLAMPSLYEGFGLPLVEAMSCGTPVLTSNVSSLPEVAGEAGLLVDPLNQSAINEGLRLLLTDDVVLSGLAHHARSQAAQFSWKKAAAETRGIFQEAFACRRLPHKG